ncbi:MAG: YdcF family protein [Cyanobacteria bacterium QS_8_64_29]|nr:MAG: YdcF family protein [Cyanobacteria bacterium QS_8_64_29]
MARRPRWRWLGAALALGLLGAASVIPLQLARARQQQPQPEAVLVLGGGGSERMQRAARLLRQRPQLEAWISAPKQTWPANRAAFRQTGVARDRLHPDFCPTDTVTNFTCLLQNEAFQAAGIQHLYVVTSDYHMRRARTIAVLVLGSRGIAVTPLAVPTSRSPEDWQRAARDALRSLLWLATGRTGAGLAQWLSTLKTDKEIFLKTIPLLLFSR